MPKHTLRHLFASQAAMRRDGLEVMGDSKKKLEVTNHIVLCRMRHKDIDAF
jgi:hypothetical protein